MYDDDIYIGSAPCDEECAQVGAEYYSELAKLECRELVRMLKEKLGTQAGTELRIKSNSHDFGSYYSVHCYFDSKVKEAIEYALKCEDECPMKWDDEARKKLRKFRMEHKCDEQGYYPHKKLGIYY